MLHAQNGSLAGSRHGLRPEKLAGHGLSKAPGPSSDNHIQGRMGRPPDAPHAEAVQGCVGGPDDSAYDCRAPVRTYAHTCACIAVITNATDMHGDGQDTMVCAVK